MESISGLESRNIQHHYQNDTVASTLPPYFHGETERITNSFRTGTCWSVKQLPHVLEYGEVQKKRHANTANNLIQKPPRIYKAVVAKKHFWNIPYVPTTYDKYHVLEKSAFEVDRNQIESTGRKAGLVIPSRIRAKYEDIFEDINYQYPTSVLGPAVGIPKLESIVREEFSDMRRFTCGVKNISTSNRKVPENELGVEWTKTIFQLLAKDWSHLKFTVKFTKSDELLVQFEVEVKANGIPVLGSAMLTSLGKYMTTLVTHGVGCEFGLRKRGDRWGQLEHIPDDSNSESVSKSRTPKKKSKLTGINVMTISDTADDESPINHGDSSNNNGNNSEYQRRSSNPDFDEAADQFPSPTESSLRFQESKTTDMMQTSSGNSEEMRLLTYSMYAPWVFAGSLNATRAAAFAGRQAARKRSDAERELEKQERLNKLSLLQDESNNGDLSKVDGKLLHVAMHGLKKSAKEILYTKRSSNSPAPSIGTARSASHNAVTLSSTVPLPTVSTTASATSLPLKGGRRVSVAFASPRQQG